MKLSSIKCLLLSVFMLGVNYLHSTEYPEPYNSMKTLPYLDHGWFLHANKMNLIRFIEQLQPKVVVEVGSWLGMSTMEMASRLKVGARLYAIDTWLGSSEHNESLEIKATILPTLFQQFLSNVKHRGLAHIIIPIRMDSLEAAHSLEVTPELIYLDAAHDTKSVFNDIVNWYPKLVTSGIMCGDDWNMPPVAKAVMEAATLFKVNYHHDDNFWYFDPK